MNNCYIIKLKGNIDDNDVKIFNALYVYLTSETPGADGQYMRVTATKNVTLKRISGTASFKVNNVSYTSYDFSAGDHVVVFDINEEGTFIFTDKTAISKISPYFDYGSSAAMTKKNWYFDIREFNYMSMSYLNLANTNSYGEFTPRDMPDLEKLLITTWDGLFKCRLETLAAAAPNLTHIWTNGNNPGLYGDISSLSVCTSLTELVDEYNLNLTGEIDSLLSALVDAGRTTGTLRFLIRDGNVTDNGSRVTTSYIRSMGGTNNILITFDPTAPSGYTKSYA